MNQKKERCNMFNNYSIINPNRYKDVMHKNACKIGVIGKKM